ncbi:MAG: aldehyde dehydrogenase family protein [Myxococcota bacterium]
MDRDTAIVRSPATGEVVGDAPLLHPEDAPELLARAREAQRAWAREPTLARCRVLGFVRDALADAADELAELVSAETGKPRFEALVHEVLVGADLASWTVREAPRVLAPRDAVTRLQRHRRSYVHRAPRGVVLYLAPWSYPLLLPLAASFASLAAGNAIVVKSSVRTPLTFRRAAAIATDAGLPRGLLQAATGTKSVGVALREAGPDLVLFAGSPVTARRVMADCARRGVPCSVELGGKTAAIVGADADLERTARSLVWGAFMNAGQASVCVERVFVHKSLEAALTARVVELTQALRVGPDTGGDDVDVGAITTEKQLEHVAQSVRRAVEEGATLLTGGRRHEGPGRFYAPTVLGGVRDEMRVAREVTFGPVLPFLVFDDERVAIARANATGPALAGYVFTRDRDRGRQLAEALRAGVVMVNGVVTAYGVSEVSFAGPWGVPLHGEAALGLVSEERHVNYGRLRVGRNPLAYPYRERSRVAVGKAMRVLYRRENPVKRFLELF